MNDATIGAVPDNEHGDFFAAPIPRKIAPDRFPKRRQIVAQSGRKRYLSQHRLLPLLPGLKLDENLASAPHGDAHYPGESSSFGRFQNAFRIVLRSANLSEKHVEG